MIKGISGVINRAVPIVDGNKISQDNNIVDSPQFTTRLKTDTISNEYYQKFQSLNNDWQNEFLQDPGWIEFKVISPKKLGRVTFRIDTSGVFQI
jgi:hypothetical protein